jgi:DNA-binding transcriptional regulator YhcF (GntR family)
VDIRTVAGRLGHSGGGTTTLRVYAAWVAEADQRAATKLASRLPNRPVTEPDGIERVLIEPRAPYERIAVELRNAILDGRFAASEPLPTIKQLADTYQVATGTAHRALSLLTDWGLIDVSRGQRATVRVSVSGEDSHNRNNMAHTTMNASLTNIKMTARTQRRRRHSYGKLPYADPTAVAIRVDMCARILTSLTHSEGTCSR